jgi:hypothetical protein
VKRRHLERAVTTAIGAEREAADRLRGAQKHLRKAIRAEEKARRDGASPEELTEDLLRARAAADVTEEIRNAGARATAARQAAEEVLSRRLAQLHALEDVAAEAERVAATPRRQCLPACGRACLRTRCPCSCRLTSAPRAGRWSPRRSPS